MLLSERTFSESIKIDRDAGVIRGVKVLGRTSKNGREYSDKALADAARIYEGVKVRFDHPPRNEPGKERQFVDSFGRLERLHLRDDGVYADLPFKKSHPLADLVCESAERFPKDFGLSHNAEGTVTTRDGKTVVESITKARGVDVVDSPASTDGLFESDPSEPSIILEMEELPMGEPDTPAHAKNLKQAMHKMLTSIIDDDSIDWATTKRKIAKVLTHYDRMTALGEPGDGKPAEAASAPEPAAAVAPVAQSVAAESLQESKEQTMAEEKKTEEKPLEASELQQILENFSKENAQLRADLDKERAERTKLEREVKARKLLESRGRPVNAESIERLLKVEQESIWLMLVEAMQPVPQVRRPARTGSILETPGRRHHSALDVHDGKSLVAALFE